MRSHAEHGSETGQGFHLKLTPMSNALYPYKRRDFRLFSRLSIASGLIPRF
jgi:hypothetical protein